MMFILELKGENKMKIYDKAKWHIDGGENTKEVIEKFVVIFTVLKSKNMLSDEGKEVMEIGIDGSVSLHERLLTEEGNVFLEQNYDSIINLKSNEIADKLSNI